MPGVGGAWYWYCDRNKALGAATLADSDESVCWAKISPALWNEGFDGATAAVAAAAVAVEGLDWM